MKRAESYRPDIDGLRAIAVVAVIFFHLRLGCPGGYVGVDVFFVISGYLITGLVTSEIEGGTFSLREFYLRRLRRLAPALLLVSIPVAIVAWLLLYPEDMRSFAASLGLQFLGLQNVFFLVDGEYFRGSATKPLLHTWSLAVEEQFYLGWPLLLVGTRRLTLHKRLLLIGLLMIASFALGLVLLGMSPKAAFFLLPARAWELALGGVVALVERGRGFANWRRGAARTIAAAIGATGILWSILFYSEETPFPAIAALLPAVGAAMVIASGVGGTSGPVARFLSHPAMVRVGLISYPLYLWHWPLIAFATYTQRTPSAPANAAVILALTIGLAEATYRFAETPIRKRLALASSRSLLATAGAVVSVLVVFSAHSYYSDGAAYRYSPIGRALLTAPFAAERDRCGFVFRMMHPASQVCSLHEATQSQRRILLWGNSHAAMWGTLLKEMGGAHGASIYINARNCRATTDSGFCSRTVQESVLKFVTSESLTDVVLASSWYGAYDRDDNEFEAELSDVVSKLSERRVRVWLVLDVPSSPLFDPIDAYTQNPESPRPGRIDSADYEASKQREASLFSRIAENTREVRIIDPSPSFCGPSFCAAGDATSVWYFDDSHLTTTGTQRASRHFLKVFEAPKQAPRATP